MYIHIFALHCIHNYVYIYMCVWKWYFNRNILGTQPILCFYHEERMGLYNQYSILPDVLCSLASEFLTSIRDDHVIHALPESLMKMNHSQSGDFP